jgi:hypothetical protein
MMARVSSMPRSAKKGILFMILVAMVSHELIKIDTKPRG